MNSIYKKFPKYLDCLFANNPEIANNLTSESPEQAPGESVMPNQRIPAFNFCFEDTYGKAYRLDDFKGKMLLLEIWASWSVPCKIQVPYLKEIEDMYAQKDIAFVSVSFESTKEQWTKAIQSMKISNLTLFAEGGIKSDFAQHYGITSVPAFVLIDEEGYLISKKMEKPENKKEFCKQIDLDLNKKEINHIIEANAEALGIANLTKGVDITFKSKYNLSGMHVTAETKYKYPKKLKYEYEFEPTNNQALLCILPENYLKKKYFLINQNEISGNSIDLQKTMDTWSTKLPGFELYLASKVNQACIVLDDENESNPDNQYVLSATYSNRTEKFYINKEDFLLNKTEVIFLPERSNPYNTRTCFTYKNYKEIRGIYVPHLTRTNDIIDTKIYDVEVRTLSDSDFEVTNQ